MGQACLNSVLPFTLIAWAERSVDAGLATILSSTSPIFIIYFRLIARLGSVATTSVGYLRVPTGVAIGIVFLGERLSATAWARLALVVVGVFAMTWPRRKTG